MLKLVLQPVSGDGDECCASDERLNELGGGYKE